MIKGATLTPEEERNLDGKNLAVALILGLFTALSFGLGGFLLIYDETGSMGGVLFLLLPSATGFATALVARRRNIVIASLILGALLCSAILLATGKEGWVCVLMSAPLIAAGLAFGALMGWLFRIFVIDKSSQSSTLTLLALLVLPVFLMGANSAERESRRTLRAQTVTDTLTVSQSPEAVWNQLKNMDSVTASKGLLMRIGLPVPGGKRTCYFEHGYIEEEITEWNFPNSMKFQITASNVPGRPWLTFSDASYAITREGNHTIVARRTTILSRLSPAWYWRRLEAVGVHTEHRYLFEAVENKLNAVK